MRQQSNAEGADADSASQVGTGTAGDKCGRAIDAGLAIGARVAASTAALVMCANTSSTPVPVFADVSTYGTSQAFANSTASEVVTICSCIKPTVAQDMLPVTFIHLPNCQLPHWRRGGHRLPVKRSDCLAHLPAPRPRRRTCFRPRRRVPRQCGWRCPSASEAAT